MNDDLSGLAAAFPPDELGIPKTPLAERAALVCSLAACLLNEMGHNWEAYNFQQVNHTNVIFNVKYPEANLTWVTSGALQFDGGSDAALAQALAAYWDREFRGVNPPKPCAE